MPDFEKLKLGNGHLKIIRVELVRVGNVFVAHGNCCEDFISRPAWASHKEPKPPSNKQLGDGGWLDQTEKMSFLKSFLDGRKNRERILSFLSLLFWDFLVFLQGMFLVF